jgi:hypothetical protein
MNSGDPNCTHRARAMDPQAFRAQATGIGQSAAASLATGSARAQRVVDQADPACLSIVPEAEGFPARTPDDLAGYGLVSGRVLSYNGSGRGKLR